MKRKYETWAYLNDKGKRIWGDIFPSGEVPVRSIITQGAKLEGVGEERVFILEWSELTPQQQEAILERLSKKSGASKDFIIKDILKIGLPLRQKYTNGAGTTRLGLFL
ncbi:MAG: hypothetical protein OEX09_09795 [Candidatus Bathyarchaeota archaeon]|nr:hypothetical protein [Candidatus Bathyarchaeota archaeon]